MENRKGFSILKAVISIIAILLIIISLALNIAFSGGKVPHVFGSYIYVVSGSELGDNVTDGAALLAKESSGSDIVKGDIVLCYTSGSPDRLQLRSVYDIVDGENGQKVYYMATAAGPDMENSITADSIAAICTGNPESLELGRYISFSTGIKGILLQLILPCVILVIFLIAKIASSNDEDDEQQYDFYEYDEEEVADGDSQPPSHVKPSTPLFEPSQEIQPSNEFERKKMSIAENFSQKQVDRNSSYQKEKERTMQFKAQRSSAPESPSANYRARHQGSAESSFAARNMGGQSSTAPTADALREEMLRKTAEAERTGTFSTKMYGNPSYSEPVSDNTGVLSKAQLAEMARNDVPKTTPLKSPVSSAAPKKKSSSPDIDDIIRKSDTNAKKKSASYMSVDDLLKMIEDEKNRL